MPAEEKPLYPFKLCRQGTHLHGQVALADLPDVGSVLSSDQGVVAYDLMCDHDDEGIARVRLHIAAELSLLCQRCLQPLVWPVEGVTLLSPVRTDVAQQQWPTAYEPLQVSATGAVLLADLLTEELWLAMPQLPRHDTSCPDQADAAVTLPAASAAPGPFVVLRELQL